MYLVSETLSTDIADQSVICSQEKSHDAQSDLLAQNSNDSQPFISTTQSHNLHQGNESKETLLDHKSLSDQTDYSGFIADYFKLLDGDRDQLPVDELVSLLESDPAFLQHLINELSAINDEALSASLGHSLKGSLAMNEVMEDSEEKYQMLRELLFASLTSTPKCNNID